MLISVCLHLPMLTLETEISLEVNQMFNLVGFYPSWYSYQIWLMISFAAQNRHLILLPVGSI